MIPAVLRTPDFRRVWLASLASNAGSWVQTLASGWLIYELTHSPAAVGALALVTRAPAFLLSTYGGSLADRFDRRAVGMATFLLQAVAAGTLALISFAGGASVAAIYVLTFAVGVGFALGLPAMLALIPTLVPAPRLSQAVSLNAAGINVARLAGPGIGAGVLWAFGATACFALNAVSFLALVWVLWRIPPRPPAAGRERSSTRQAIAYARRDPAMVRLLLGVGLFTALASPIQELAPVVAARLDAGPVGLGLLLGAMGGGALGGAWLLEHLHGRGLPRHRALPISTIAFSAGLAVVAITSWLAVAVVGMAFAGAFWIWQFAATNTAIQLRAPLPLLGRMLGLYQLAVIGPIAIGSSLAGLVAQAVGIEATLLGCAALLALWGAWSLRNAVVEIDAGRWSVDEAGDRVERPVGDPALDL